MWMEVAVVATIFAVGNILFGHWQAETPKWHRVLKFVIVLALTVLISTTFGHLWAFLFVGTLVLTAAIVHGFWLPWRTASTAGLESPRRSTTRYEGGSIRRRAEVRARCLTSVWV